MYSKMRLLGNISNSISINILLLNKTNNLFQQLNPITTTTNEVNISVRIYKEASPIS
jgi:hypothetical protein